jgi:HptB-dependent secretion and biofilm anti anti-sigma factor
MDFHIQSNDNLCSIFLIGRLTYNDHQKVRSIITAASAIMVNEVLLDMAGLEFIDSAGVGMILIANEELGIKQKKIIITNATGQVGRVLRISQISKLLPVEIR